MLWIGTVPRVTGRPYPIRALKARWTRMQLDLSFEPRPHFDGSTYEPAQDQSRLRRQLEAVKAVMRDDDLHAALLRQITYSLSVLAVEIPLGILLALSMYMKLLLALQ